MLRKIDFRTFFVFFGLFGTIFGQKRKNQAKVKTRLFSRKFRHKIWCIAHIFIHFFLSNKKIQLISIVYNQFLQQHIFFTFSAFKLFSDSQVLLKWLHIEACMFLFSFNVKFLRFFICKMKKSPSFSPFGHSIWKKSLRLFTTMFRSYNYTRTNLNYNAQRLKRKRVLYAYRLHVLDTEGKHTTQFILEH